LAVDSPYVPQDREHSISLALWRGCGGDPVNYSDPSGLWRINREGGFAESEEVSIHKGNMIGAAFSVFTMKSPGRGETLAELYDQMGGLGGTGRTPDQFVDMLNSINPGLNLSGIDQQFEPGHGLRIKSKDGTLSAEASAVEKGDLAKRIDDYADGLMNVSNVQAGTIGLTIAARSEQRTQAYELRAIAVQLRGGRLFTGSTTFAYGMIGSTASTGKGIGDAIYRSDMTLSQKTIGVATDVLSVAPGLGAIESRLTASATGAMVDSNLAKIGVNIDTGTAVSFVSEGSAIRHQLKAFVAGKEMQMTRTALAEFQGTLRSAGPLEAARAQRFLARVRIIADNPSLRAISLRVTKSVGANDIIIFGTGDQLGITTMSSDAKFMRGALSQGVDFDAFIHQAFPFTGR